MKTKITLMSAICALCFLASPAKSQLVTGGLTGGVTTGSVKIDEIDDSFINSIEGKGIMGFEAGGFVRLKFLNFYVRPHALYSFTNGEVQVNDEGEGQVTSDFEMHKFELPVFLGWKLIGPVAIEAAPVYNYLINITEQYGTDNVQVAKSGVGYRFGVALDFSRFFVNVNYQGVKYGATGNFASYKEPYKLIFGLGIALGQGNGRDSRDDERGDNE